MKSYVQSTRALNPDYNSLAKKRNSMYLGVDNTHDLAALPYILSNANGYIGIFALYNKVLNYTGPSFTLRRSSDSAEKDFVDITGVSAWLNGATGTIKIWYDQTGNGKHFTETTGSAQPPLILADGTMGGKPTMDLSLTTGMSGTITNTATANHCYTIAYTNYATGGRRVIGGSNNFLIGPYNDVYNVFAGGFSSGPATTRTGVIQTAYRFASGNYFNRVNGVGVGGSAGSTTAGTVNLGIRGAFSEGPNSRLAELLIKDGTQNLADVAQVESFLNNRYRIY